MTATRRSPLLGPAMLGVASGAVLVPLNSTMLAVALPSIMDDFGIDAATVSTLVTLYLGAVTIALLASGSLGDRYGQRPVFLVGVVAFALSSLLAGLAPSFAILTLGRVLQALSGALISTTSVALVRALAPPDRRGAAFGMFDMLVSISAAIAPFLGGVLVGAFGWRSLFVLAIPFAIFAAVTVGLVARPVASASEGAAVSAAVARRSSIDIVGLGLLAAVLIALLVTIRGLGDGSPAALAIVAVPILAILFVRYELEAERPAVDPRLFRSRGFTAAVLGVLGTTVVLHASFILVPLLVERLEGGSAETAGLVLLGISGTWAIAAPFGGRLSDRLGRRRPVVAGSVVLTAGLVGLWLLAADTTILVLAGLMAIVGLGMGFAGSPRQAAAMDAIPSDRVGMAAGTYYTGRYLGGVIGASLAGTVLGATVTASGVTLGFGILVLVGLAVIAVSFGLPDRATHHATAATDPGLTSPAS